MLDHQRHEAGAATIRVLVVDDDPLVVLVMEGVMSGIERVEVVAAHDVNSALTCLETRPIDLVLTDYHLGDDLTGLALIAMIRARWPEVIAVLVTGSLTPSLRAAALAEGARACLAKPSSMSELRSMLDLVPRSLRARTAP